MVDSSGNQALSYSMISYDIMRLSSFMMSLRQCPWEIGSALTERGRWVGSHQGKKSMVMSGFGCGKALVSTNRAISLTMMHIIMHHETLSFLMSYLATSLGDREKG